MQQTLRTLPYVMETAALTLRRFRQDERRSSLSVTVRAWIDRVIAEPTTPRSRFETSLQTASRSLVQFAKNRAFLADVTLASAVFAVGCVTVATGESIGIKPWLLTVVICAPLVFRRRFPLTVFLCVAVIAFIQWLANVQTGADVALLVGLFTVADERPRRMAVAAAALCEVGAILAAARWTLAETAFRSFIFLSGLVAVALLLGANTKARRAHVTSLIERAEQLEIERDQQAQIAAAAERTRIAREMHDVIAHTLAVVIALVDGATAKLRKDPEQARAALQNVAGLSRQTLDDTRRLLGVLRTQPDTEDRLPQPGVAALDDLVQQIVATGRPATLTIKGAPFDVPPGPALSLYRIAQEATTNVLKHAPHDAVVAITLSYRSRTNLELSIHNDGEIISNVQLRTNQLNGYGIAGMRERAALYNGSLVAGPDELGGWTVRAQLVITERNRA